MLCDTQHEQNQQINSIFVRNKSPGIIYTHGNAMGEKERADGIRLRWVTQPSSAELCVYKTHGCLSRGPVYEQIPHPGSWADAKTFVISKGTPCQEIGASCRCESWCTVGQTADAYGRRGQVQTKQRLS